MKLICSISSLLLCNNSVTLIDNTQLSLYMSYEIKVSYSNYSHIQSYKCIRVLCSSGSLCSSSHVRPTGGVNLNKRCCNVVATVKNNDIILHMSYIVSTSVGVM
jgi:hypothetical protein